MSVVDDLRALQATLDKTVDCQRCERIDEMISWHLGSQSEANTLMDNTLREGLLEIQQNRSGANFMR